MFHAYYKPDGWERYLGSFIFDATDTTETQNKLVEAENAAKNGKINDLANTAQEIVECGVEVAVAVIPGPDDVLIGAFVQQAITKFAAQGTKATYQAGKWLFTKAGRLLAGKAAEEEERAFRTVVFGELQQVTWAPSVKTLSQQYAKHIPKSNAWTRDIIQKTFKADALYKPGQDIEMLERRVWQSGTPVTNGKNWKVYEFDHVIGASDGKEVRWVRVEGTGGPGNTVIHGHPITQVTTGSSRGREEANAPADHSSG